MTRDNVPSFVYRNVLPSTLPLLIWVSHDSTSSFYKRWFFNDFETSVFEIRLGFLMSSCFLVPIQENPEISAQQSTESAASLQGFSCFTVCCIYILNVHTWYMYLYNALLWILKETRLNSLNFTPIGHFQDLQSTAIVAYSILKRLIQVPKGAKKIALQSEVPLVLQLGRRVDWSGSGAPCSLGPPEKRVIHSKHFLNQLTPTQMSNRPQNKFQQCKTVWLIASLFVLVFFHSGTCFFLNGTGDCHRVFVIHGKKLRYKNVCREEIRFFK